MTYEHAKKYYEDHYWDIVMELLDTKYGWTNDDQDFSETCFKALEIADHDCTDCKYKDSLHTEYPCDVCQRKFLDHYTQTEDSKVERFPTPTKTRLECKCRKCGYWYGTSYGGSFCPVCGEPNDVTMF